MADPTVRSYSYVSAAGQVPPSFGKPAGLAAGDLLVLIVWSTSAYPSGTPSGFTQQAQSSDAVAQRSTLYTKVADAADAAASAFVVPNALSCRMGGVLYAVKDGSTADYCAASQVVGGSGASVSGFTPAAANDLLILGTHTNGSPLNPTTANNNPSWTQDRLDGDWWSGISFHATYASAAATGNITGVTTSGKDSSFVVIGITAAVAAPAAGNSSTPHDHGLRRRRG